MSTLVISINSPWGIYHRSWINGYHRWLIYHFGYYQRDLPEGWIQKKWSTNNIPLIPHQYPLNPIKSPLISHWYPIILRIHPPQHTASLPGHGETRRRPHRPPSRTNGSWSWRGIASSQSVPCSSTHSLTGESGRFTYKKCWFNGI